MKAARDWCSFADERELERAIESAWHDWSERLRRGAALKGSGALVVDATVPPRRKRRGTGGVPGRPRAVDKWDDRLIREARADYLARPSLHGRGAQGQAVGHVVNFLKAKGIKVDEIREFRTIVRRIIKGKNYKYASDKKPQPTKP
jgi:hypothetical protein